MRHIPPSLANKAINRSSKWNYNWIFPSGLLYLLATVIIYFINGNYVQVFSSVGRDLYMDQRPEV